MGEYDSKVAELEQRAKSNTRRIEKLEQSTDALNDLTLAVREMVVKQEHIAKVVDKLDSKVEALENKPAKKWEEVSDRIIFMILASVVTLFLSNIGLG